MNNKFAGIRRPRIIANMRIQDRKRPIAVTHVYEKSETKRPNLL